MRVEAGAVVDEFDLPGIGHVVARHTRTKTPDGGVTWACMFTVVAAGASDLAVVHRLSAPNLAEGRRSVRHAVEFLAGRAVTADAADDHVWRPPAGHPVYTGPKHAVDAGKRAPDRRVALSPANGRGRRATDVRRHDPDRGLVPDLGGAFADPAHGAPVLDLGRSDASSDGESPAPIEPTPAPTP